MRLPARCVSTPSTVTIAEVAYHESEKGAGALDPAVEHDITSLWDAPSPVRLMEFHELIRHDARRLIRSSLTEERALKPLDAIHLASAMRVGAALVHTYDKKWSAYQRAIGIPVDRPAPLVPTLFTADDATADQTPPR